MSGRPKGYIPVCMACSVVLTPENRYQARSLCLEHGREAERRREATRSRARVRRKAADAAQRGAKAAQEAARVAPGWNDVKEAELRRRLLSALPMEHKRIGIHRSPEFVAHLRAYELTEQLREALDHLDHLGDLDPERPDHFTTRLEFLSDADSYGV